MRNLWFVAAGFSLALVAPARVGAVSITGPWNAVFGLAAALLLATAVRGLPPRAVFLGSWWAATLGYTLAFHWLVPALHQHGELSLPLSLALIAALGAYSALYVAAPLWLAARLEPRVRFSLGAPALLALAEWCRGWMLGGDPLHPFALALHGTPLRALVAILGQAGATWWLWAVGFLLAAAMRTPLPAVLRAQSALLVVTVLFSLAWVGRAPAPAVSGEVDALRIALVQPNIDQSEKWDEAYRVRNTHRLQALARKGVEQGAALWIEPETSAGQTHDLGRDRLHPQLRVPVEGAARLLGAPGYSSEHPAHHTNSSLLVDSDGAVLGRYDKQRLVPFGEALPSWLGWAEGILPALAQAGFFRAGPRDGLVTWRGLQMGLLICYEDMFEAPSRRWAREGADVLVVQTNDAWYGHTAAAEIHLAMGRLRSVETGLPSLRVANTGPSAFVDGDGRLLGLIPEGTAGVLVVDVEVPGRRNPLSSVQPMLAVLLGLVLPLGPLLFRRRSGVDRRAFEG